MLRRLLCALLLISSFSFAQSKRPFTFEDMMKLKRVAEPYLSPDGKWAAFGVTDVSLEENKKTNHIWIVPVAGGETRQLTNGKGEDNIRFSPDGKQVLFIASPDGQSQVYTQAFDTATGTLTGEPRKLTSISTEVNAATWSPDGKSILFVSAVWPDCKDDACNKQRDDERAKSKVKAQVFTHLLYRHWNAYGNGKRSHLFLQSVEGRTPLDLTPGDHDVPPFSLGGQDQYSFSPDSKEIAYASNLDEVEATSTNTDIFVVPATGGTAKKISTAAGADSTPLYSPDGKYIAFRSQARGGYESDRFRLMLYDIEKASQWELTTCETRDKKGNIVGCQGTPYLTELTKGFDGWADNIVWSPNSKRIYFTAEYHGESPIYAVSIDNDPRFGGPGVRLIEHGFNDALALAAMPDGTQRLVIARMSVQWPNELFVRPVGIPGYEMPEPPSGDINTTNMVTAKAALTHINAPVLDQVEMPPLENYWFTGAENVKVQAFVVKPPNFDKTKKYPVKFLIHGGPQGAWGDDWSYRWNPELFAANGYVVIMVNPRGSTGYGQKFIDDINGDWGGRAFQDLMLGLDYAEKNFSYIDKNRECALGASYGGYAANWLEGHTTRFKCIVSHDGMFNTVSAFGTTEELWFNTWEFKGTPWTNPEMYKKWSPNQSVLNFKTPMLVVHGQLDYRLDVSEGFQLFTYLQLMKVPSKMLYFPDEGHWVLKPQNSQLWWKTVTDWVDQWTNTNTQH